MIKFLKNLFSNSNESEDFDESEAELWLMIKENEFFRDESHLKIIDELAEIIEGEGLGELDGHSSGAHQLEINFIEVTNYNKCKKIVADYLVANYQNLEYTVSKEYETTYEKL